MRRDAGRDSSARPGSGRITDILSSRIRLRPREPERSHRFYRDSLGFAIYREFGHPGDRGLAFFLGQGFLEVAGRSKEAVARGLAIWLQVRDVQAEYERLRVAGVRVRREPKQESWGLVEMWIEDPDGVRIVLVEVPENHPLRRDQR